MNSAYQHAQAILKEAESWEWPNIIQGELISEGQHSSHEAVAVRLLSGLIKESIQLGGTVLDQFWSTLESCHHQLSKNVTMLRTLPFISENKSLEVFFSGIKRGEVDFRPVLEMAENFFVHLGLAILNPAGRQSGETTPLSDSEAIEKDTNELLEMIEADRSNDQRRQALIQHLLLRRDGPLCPISASPFRPYDPDGYIAIVSHIIPNAVHEKPDTLECIAMFAGTATRDEVMTHLNGHANAMNLQHDAHTAYDRLEWGIEAKEENGEVTYIYRRVPHNPNPGPKPITLKDGDRITFGGGPDGMQLDGGPLPRLCNLHLAVARVLKMSGAEDVISRWKDEADDGDLPHVYIASESFCDILDAKLLLSGRSFSR